MYQVGAVQFGANVGCALVYVGQAIPPVSSKRYFDGALP